MLAPLDFELDALLTSDPGWDRATLADLVCDAQRVRARFDVWLAQVTRRADLAQAGLADGARTVAGLVADRTGEDPRKVRADLARGRRLADLDLVEAAVIAGELPGTFAEMICGLYRDRHLRPLVIEHQAHLVELASIIRAGGGDTTEYRRVLLYWVNAVDPDGKLPAEQERRRGVSLRQLPDGTWRLTGDLTAEAGASLSAAIGQRADHHGAAALERLRQDQPAATMSDLDTTETQRRHDALIELTHAGAHAKGVARPITFLVMSQAVADAAIAQLDDPTVTVPLDSSSVDGRCELIDGTPLHPHTALRILATSTLHRLVLEAPSRILDLGRSARGFPPYLRNALLVAHRGRCVGRGCDAAWWRLQGDHIAPWRSGGATATHNGQNACGPDNRWRNQHE
jgi:hypothetical protein